MNTVLITMFSFLQGKQKKGNLLAKMQSSQSDPDTERGLKGRS